jgi:hypothetical protein
MFRRIGASAILGSPVRDHAAFDQRLQQAAAWCAAHASAVEPQTSLRSVELRPRVLENGYESTVVSVCWQREAALRQDDRARKGLGAKPAGRLLVYLPDSDLADGAAEIESGGFFDVHSCPPWDTWVAFSAVRQDSGSAMNILIAWVPAALESHAASGIDANPECIRWLDASLAKRLGIA